jgi:hypothetical protein
MAPISSRSALGDVERDGIPPLPEKKTQESENRTVSAMPFHRGVFRHLRADTPRTGRRGRRPAQAGAHPVLAGAGEIQEQQATRTARRRAMPTPA